MGKITSIEEYGQGTKIFGLNLEAANPAQCSNTSTLMPSPAADAKAVDRMNATVLAAFMSGKSVQVKVSDAGCVANLPYYYAVRIVD